MKQLFWRHKICSTYDVMTIIFTSITHPNATTKSHVLFSLDSSKHNQDTYTTNVVLRGSYVRHTSVSRERWRHASSSLSEPRRDSASRSSSLSGSSSSGWSLLSPPLSDGAGVDARDADGDGGSLIGREMRPKLAERCSVWSSKTKMTISESHKN